MIFFHDGNPALGLVPQGAATTKCTPRPLTLARAHVQPFQGHPFILSSDCNPGEYSHGFKLPEQPLHPHLCRCHHGKRARQGKHPSGEIHPAPDRYRCGGQCLHTCRLRPPKEIPRHRGGPPQRGREGAGLGSLCPEACRAGLYHHRLRRCISGRQRRHATLHRQAAEPHRGHPRSSRFHHPVRRSRCQPSGPAGSLRRWRLFHQGRANRQAFSFHCNHQHVQHWRCPAQWLHAQPEGLHQERLAKAAEARALEARTGECSTPPNSAPA